MKFGDLVWIFILLAVSASLLLPGPHHYFVVATTHHPYLMGFGKFAVLAPLGELLALRVISGRWAKPSGFWAKVVVWGIIGVLIPLMFTLYSAGVTSAVAKGLLPGAQGWLGTLLVALYIAVIMNFTFGPVFMGAHRISDVWIDACAEKGRLVGIAKIVDHIEWGGFIRFVVCRTVPLFWVPAHTITFLLPPEYRVLMAAYLGIALGVILAYARRKDAQARVGAVAQPAH